MDSKKVLESVCNIETEICNLHQLIAAETGGTQPTDVQQLKVSIALWEKIRCYIGRQHESKESLWLCAEMDAVFAQRETI
jgi:hypothetical protein